MSLDAIHPHRNATVFASAGTGKTWLLVARLARLLLAGARPGSILALTFTKKAAGEMQERLLARMEAWAVCDDETLLASLREIGISDPENHVDTARSLYETLLDSRYPVRSSTYHAFCHDLLSRFPLEAGIPPGYELIENPLDMQEEAWEALMKQAESDLPLRQDLLTLVELVGGMFNLKTVMNAFLAQRSDWWAYTEHQQEPLTFALDRLQTIFNIEQGFDPTTELDNDIWRHQISRLATLCNHTTCSASNKKIAAGLQAALTRQDVSSEAFFNEVKTAAYTTTDTLRKLNTNQKMAKAMGDDYDALTTLWEQLGARIERVQAQLNDIFNANLNAAWYRAGSTYLALYQNIKLTRRELDFSDMEWRAYQLLNDEEAGRWVQFKLDQRIDHLLIDEFQDTNPTQWRLLLPILQEFASGDPEQWRSVFLVGDTKQSIYSFRRANPRLQGEASSWLREHMDSTEFSMQKSRRSAPAIMQAVNAVFAADPFKQQIPAFPPHDTFLGSLWGRVEIHPPQAPEPEPAPEYADTLRNPLHEALAEKADKRSAEAALIARRIQELVDSGMAVGSGASARPLRYGDIKILMRQSTGADTLEKALRAAGIPYLGMARGKLLPRLELRDIRTLLRFLHAPQDNLALAQVLKSPLFDASDEHLMMLARPTGASWFDRLKAESDPLDEQHPLRRAATLLPRWMGLASGLPLHDLLETVYFEGEVVARYEAACKDWQRPQVKANLQQLIALALEIDSGRYPAMNHFLSRLEKLEKAERDGPSEPRPDMEEAPVELLTIHKSKGLEAPVIIYSDLGQGDAAKDTWNTLVDWPSDAPCPQHFLLVPPKAKIAKALQALQQNKAELQNEENGNLVYVALTRPRQMLILTSSETSRSRETLYDSLVAALAPLCEADETGVLSFETGTRPAVAPPPLVPEAAVEIDPRLLQPLTLPATIREISPSRQDGETGNIDGLASEPTSLPRGNIIHSLLEWLCEFPHWSEKALLQRASANYNLLPQDPELLRWLDEARRTIAAFPALFQPDPGVMARNEQPLVYLQGQQRVYGIVDRLLVSDDEIIIIDYKTHRIQNTDQAAQLAGNYRKQLALYARGLAMIWPGRQLKACLLFTALPHLHEIPLSHSDIEKVINSLHID